MAPSTTSQRNVVFVDGIRTPFGKAGPKGMYAETRADDLVVKTIRELLRRNPQLDPARIDEGTRFKEDLEADSLDLYTLVQELEDTYGVKMSDEQAARVLTVGQAVDFVLAHHPSPS